MDTIIGLCRIEEILFIYKFCKSLKDKQIKIAGVHAQDPQRLEKVQAFREKVDCF